MNIETADISDAEEILALQKLAYVSEAEIYNDYGIPPLRQTLEQVRSLFGTRVVLKAVQDGRIIGSVQGLVEDGVCTVLTLIVHPDFQNKGIGTSLIRKVEEICGDCKRFEIFTGHRSERNLYLYQKLGYRKFKTEKLTDGIDLVYLAKETS